MINIDNVAPPEVLQRAGQEAQRTRKATSRQAHEPTSRRAHKRAS